MELLRPHTGTIFIIILLANAVLMMTLLQSRINLRRQIWPPPMKFSWQYFYDWILNILVLFGPVLLGILDWNNSMLKDSWRFLPGGLFVLGGLAFCEWGEKSLEKYGHGKLVTRGAYQYSQHPQYVGNIAFLLGLAICSNSFLTLIVSMLGSICFFIAPLDEEVKLKEKFGSTYEEYRRGRPKFIGFFKEANLKEKIDV